MTLFNGAVEALQVNRWYTLEVRFGAASGFQMLLDGVLLASSAGTTVGVVGSQGVVLGASQNGLGRTAAVTGQGLLFAFQGRMDNVVLDDELLTEAVESADTLDFAALGAGATVDLSVTGAQVVSAGVLSLQLSSDTGIENVVGSAFADTVSGNATDNRVGGARRNAPRCRIEIMYGVADRRGAVQEECAGVRRERQPDRGRRRRRHPARTRRCGRVVGWGRCGRAVGWRWCGRAARW